MDRDITDFFANLISQSGSYDIAKAEFGRLMAEDDNLRDEYREWCEANGYSERNGFDHYCDEHMASTDSVWDSLNDFDE